MEEIKQKLNLILDSQLVVQTEVIRLNSKIDKLDEKFEKKFEETNQRIDKLDEKFEKKFEETNQRIDELDEKFEKRIDSLEETLKEDLEEIGDIFNKVFQKLPE